MRHRAVPPEPNRVGRAEVAVGAEPCRRWAAGPRTFRGLPRTVTHNPRRRSSPARTASRAERGVPDERRVPAGGFVADPLHSPAMTSQISRRPAGRQDVLFRCAAALLSSPARAPPAPPASSAVAAAPPSRAWSPGRWIRESSTSWSAFPACRWWRSPAATARPPRPVSPPRCSAARASPSATTPPARTSSRA